MPRYTVFTLAGPLASFGGVAGNERRSSMDRPGHSMLVGLLGAALGIRRSDEAGLASLSAACRFAVRADDPGQPLLDYHTVQSARLRRGFAPATRKDLIEGARAKGWLETTLTRREYRSAVRFTVAVSLLDGGAVGAEVLELRLRRPVFVLYLGRKSCPPALPLDPATIEAETVDAALAAYDEATARRAQRFWQWPRQRRDGTVAGEASLFADDPHGRRERRRVRPTARGTWQFALLDELVLAPPPRSGGTGP